VTDDRQTDHATEKRVGIGGTTYAARGIPPNENRNKTKTKKPIQNGMWTKRGKFYKTDYLQCGRKIC